MDNEFKWLRNPSNKTFIFQYDSEEFEVPAQSRKLFPKSVAEHGAKRSFALTDPVIDEEGNVLSTGNDIIQRCFVEEADVTNRIGFQEPLIIEKSRDVAKDVVELMGDLKPRKPGRPKKDAEMQNNQINE